MHIYCVFLSMFLVVSFILKFLFYSKLGTSFILLSLLIYFDCTLSSFCAQDVTMFINKNLFLISDYTRNRTSATYATSHLVQAPS